MSTTIPLHPTLAHIHDTPATLFQFDGERVDIQLGNMMRGDRKTAVTTRTALLDAIRTELGAIVIDKTDLPDMFKEQAEAIVSNTVGTLAEITTGNVKQARDRALAILAATAYLEANPPTDPAAVADFTQALTDVEMDHPDGPMPNLIAKRLVQAGYRLMKVPS